MPPWHFGGRCPPAHPSTHRLGPLRGRLAPLPPSLSGLDARNALWGLPSRAPFGCCSAPRSLRSLGGRRTRACGARPPALRGLPAGDQVGGLRPPLPAPSPLRVAAAAFRSLRALHSAGRHWSPFGRPRIRSALTAAMPQPLRCAPCLWPVGVRLAPLPALRCAPFRSVRDFALRRSLQGGGSCASSRLRRPGLRPPLRVGRWGALKLTTAAVASLPVSSLRSVTACQLSPGGSPRRSAALRARLPGRRRDGRKRPAPSPTLVPAGAPVGRLAGAAWLPSGLRFASPQSALEAFGLGRQGLALRTAQP